MIGAASDLTACDGEPAGYRHFGGGISGHLLYDLQQTLGLLGGPRLIPDLWPTDEEVVIGASEQHDTDCPCRHLDGATIEAGNPIIDSDLPLGHRRAASRAVTPRRPYCRFFGGARHSGHER